VPPDQLCLDGFEKRLDSSVVITVSLAGHRHLELMLPQDFLIIVRAILRSTVRVVNTLWRRLAQIDRHLQGTDRKVAFHAIGHGPADDASGIEINDHSQIQPNTASLRVSKRS